MKFQTHPHKSDLLELTQEDLKHISSGQELKVSALVIRLEREPKPDFNQTMDVYMNKMYQHYPDGFRERRLMIDNFALLGTMNLTFDGETGKLKSAEVV
jgi:hypothetical protein